ncbi:MAG: aminotransferase class I/II-fold pyridoxal phosphate-dependent enzyme [Halobacteriales archaeon]|nr:aminotransferase class I/II-fold pyridoxal phosphate-dependent enzyme [Halobacteriales archaeon]
MTDGGDEDGGWSGDIAERVEAVPPSGIRKFFELAEEQEDVISLGVGEPDFSAPWSALEAGIVSLENGRTSYTANRGKRELRDEIARDSRRFGLEYSPDDEILVTTGVSEGVDLAFRALFDPGDTVAVVQPAYVSYVPGVTFAGAEPLPVPTRAEDDFKLTYDTLAEAGAEEADGLVYCYPNNPTGAVMTRDELREVAKFCCENDLIVLADEVYADLTYDTGGGDEGKGSAEHASIATLDGMRERTVVFNGFSKAYAMTGTRLGYALGPSDAIGAMNRVHQYTMLSAPTTAQYMAIDALQRCRDDVEEMRRAYNRRRNLVLSRLDEIGMDCFEAKGAFYVFPKVPDGNDDEFAEGLLEEEEVAAVPGSVFGEGGEGHLRMSYATGTDELKEAMKRIERFVEEKY